MATDPFEGVDAIREDVQELILSIVAGHEIGSSKLKKYSNLMMCHILCEKHVPSPNEVEAQLNAFIVKYDNEGFVSWSEGLKFAVNTVLNREKFKISNYNILVALLVLSSNAFKTSSLMRLDERLKSCENVTLTDEFPEEENFDWFAYLQEGSERFRLLSEDSETSIDSNDLNGCGSTTLKNIESNCPDITLKNVNPIPYSRLNQIFDPFPQENVVVENIDDVLRKNITAANNSKMWLLNNIQHTWWAGDQSFTSNCRFPAGKFGLRWELLKKESFGLNDFTSAGIQFYEEYKMIRELLSLFPTNVKHVDERTDYLLSCISVPSLSQGSTLTVIEIALSAAKSYCKLFEYCDSVFNQDLQHLTFSNRAYASVLKEFCEKLLVKVKNEEEIVRKQNDSYTFLLLYDNLQSDFFDINFICKIHESCILDEEESYYESWFSIVRLLSRIFHKLREVTCSRYKKILLKIFFKTFEAYAAIIDNWLTNGKLYDPKNEFFIKRDLHDNSYKAFPMEKRMKKSEQDIAPFFYGIVSELLNCSHNIEFLCKVDKLRSIQEEILENGKLMDNLIDVFTKCLFSPNEQGQSVIELEVHQEPEIMRNEFVEISSNSDFLLQAYCNVFELIKNTSHINSSNLRKDWINELENLDVFPVSTALENALCSLISSRSVVIAKWFKISIIDDYKLFDHFKGLSNLLLMDFHSITSRLSARLERQIWEGSHMMKNFLYDCVESNKLPYGNLVHFNITKENLFTCNDGSVCISDLIGYIDKISLQYTASWPISMIITDSIISNFYDPLLKLILKINVAYFAMTRLSFKDLPGTRLWRWKLRKMEMLKHWVILLLQKLRSYIMLIVPQCLDEKIMESAIEIDTCNKLEMNYSNYLEKIKDRCLIDFASLNSFNSALDRLWRVCDDVRDVWLKGMNLQLTDQDVTQAVELYVQCLWYLTEIFKKMAESKRFNDPFHILYSNFQSMVDVHEMNIPEDLSFKVGL